MLERGSKSQRCQSSEQLWNFFRRVPNDFLSQLVTMDETWLYHYDPETKQQSVEWITSPQKIPNAKIRWKSSRFDFLGSRRYPHWLSSKGPKYQRRVLLISADAIEGHFEGKTLREVHQGGLVLARQCPGSPGTFNPEKTGLPGLSLSWSPTLFCGSGPVGLPPVPWTEKKQLKVRHFSSDAEVVAAAETRLDGQHSDFFLWVACKRFCNGLRSVLSFVGITLNKSRVWSL